MVLITHSFSHMPDFVINLLLSPPSALNELAANKLYRIIYSRIFV